MQAVMGIQMYEYLYKSLCDANLQVVIESIVTKDVNM